MTGSPDAGEALDAAALYDAIAAGYAADGERNAYNALYERPATIALLPPVRGRRVLDVGCGAGPLSAWLVAHGAEVTGFDISAAMLALARRRVPSARLVVGDLARPLDFLEDDSFDVVVASLVLHYLRDWVAPLRELRRVLTSDGALVLSTHHPATDVRLSASGDYHATELIHDRWSTDGQTIDMRFYRRPLGAIFDAIHRAGLRVDRLVEPLPLPECRERFPDAWARLTREPGFLHLRLTPA